jgi:hypothetical protein
MVWMLFGSMQKLAKVKEIENKQKSLSALLNFKDFDNAVNTNLIIYFNSECEFCQTEMQLISNNFSSLQDYQIILISHEPKESALKFLSEYNLRDYYLEIVPEKVMQMFTGGVPQTLIYKSDKLVKHFRGAVKIETLLAEIEKHESS